MKRNASIISPRVETSLEMKRSQLTKEKLDPWYTKFREFLQCKGLIYKKTNEDLECRGRIYHGEGRGGQSIVFGPARRDLHVETFLLFLVESNA